jgi:Putative DNA-binding domain
MSDLDRIQRWLQAVITHPGGIAAGAASDEARREIDVAPEALEQVVTRSRALSAADRLAVYGNAYYARLLECLREQYPVLAKTVGEEVFDDFAFGYLQRYPSRSYTLNELGRLFPDYLAETCPRDEGDGGWPDFLIDLATLEWTYDEVFDGPGVEGQPLLTAEQLTALSPDRWPEARLVFVPCFRTLALRYPVHEYYRAVRDDEEAVPPGPAATFLAITRQNYTVRRYPLARPEYELLLALTAGQPVGQVVAAAAEKAETDLDAFAEELRGWFARWTAEGFIQAVKLSD